MSQAPDKYSQIHFQGVRTPTALSMRERSPRLAAVAPSPSIFAKSFRPHAPVVSPVDRLLLDYLFKRAQITGSAYRPSALGRRIPACLRALQVRSPAEAIRRIEQDPEALDAALNALLIGVTTFFRDVPCFNHLRQHALPDLLRSSPMPRVLSVGCSDGAEAYSLAMVLLEVEPASMRPEGFEIRGIDCRRCAIARAQAGIFPAMALDNLSPAQKERYFDQDARSAQVQRWLRDRVQFQVTDVLIHIPQPPYDLIACRNVAIYLEPPAVSRLWRRLHGALRPGGLLMTGKAERPMGNFMRVGPCLFRKASP